MKLKKTNAPSIFALIFILIFIFALNSCTMLAKVGTISNETTIKEQESKETEIISGASAADQIRVLKPQPNQVIESPLIIEGEARGTWFFEATFPVKLLDANGNVIAAHYAEAQGDWMTADFVPFKAQLIFEKPATDYGVLVLEKDNPSGLPENDAKIEIPVYFNGH